MNSLHTEEPDKEIHSHLNYILQLWRKSLRRQTDISEGVNVDGENLTNLRFADDVALFNETTKQMEKTLKQSEHRKSESWLNNTQRKDKVHDKPCRQ